MTESNIQSVDVAVTFDEQIEPVVLASVTEATGSAPGGEGDERHSIIWGNE